MRAILAEFSAFGAKPVSAYRFFFLPFFEPQISSLPPAVTAPWEVNLKVVETWKLFKSEWTYILRDILTLRLNFSWMRSCSDPLWFRWTFFFQRRTEYFPDRSNFELFQIDFELLKKSLLNSMWSETTYFWCHRMSLRLNLFQTRAFMTIIGRYWWSFWSSKRRVRRLIRWLGQIDDVFCLNFWKLWSWSHLSFGFSNFRRRDRIIFKRSSTNSWVEESTFITISFSGVIWRVLTIFEKPGVIWVALSFILT